MKILFYLAVWMVVLHPMNQALILLNYSVNKNYIIEHFCINKAKPKMKCDGKCHLRKELQKSEEQQKEEPKNLNEFVQLVYCFENFKMILIPPSGTEFKFVPGKDIYYSSCLLDIFHPPTVFC